MQTALVNRKAFSSFSQYLIRPSSLSYLCYKMLFFDDSGEQSFYNFITEYYCPNVLDYQEKSLDIKGKIV
jgi:hypothetical protein